MRKIATLSKKGGSGKTTLLVLLREALTQAGSIVEIRDYDSQGSASKSLRAVGGASPANPSIILFDTPPSLSSPATDSAAREAEIVLVPTSPSPLDLWEAAESASFVKQRNPKARVVIVLNKLRPGTLLGAQSKEYLSELGLEILPVTMGDRQSYQRAILDGWQALDGVAREELLAFSLAVTNLNHNTVMQ